MNSIRFTDCDNDKVEFEDSSDDDLMVRVTSAAGGAKLVLLEREQVQALASFLAERVGREADPRPDYIVRYEV